MKKTITKEFKFDMAHRLYDITLGEEENKKLYGKCFNIHGHTYHLFVTVSGEEQNGMVINFIELKRIVNDVINKYDHKILLSEGDKLVLKLEEHAICIVGPTTCENQIVKIWEKIREGLEEINIVLEELKLYETETSYATLTK